MRRATILNSSQTDKWDAAISKLPTKLVDIYYISSYYKLHEDLGDGIANCFIYQNNTEIAIYPYLKNPVDKDYSSRFKNYYDIQGAYGYNGILSSTSDPDFIAEFYQEFTLHCREQNIIAEFTRFNPLLENHRLSQQHLDVSYNRETVILNLDKPYADIWSKDYSGNNRNMIRKASKKGVILKLSKNISEYYLFADLYRNTMVDLEADDYFKFDNTYFKNVYSQFHDKTDLILAFMDEKLIAGSMFLTLGDYYHYHLSARLREYQEYSPTNLILNEAIIIAKARGCKNFHFGGGLNIDPKNSLLKFKSNFSKERGAFFIGTKIYNESIYRTIVDEWENKFPEKKAISKNIFLKYRS